MANHVNSTAVRSSPAPTPHHICFKALNEIENAMVDLGVTLSATLRLAEAETSDDPTKYTFFDTMERHLMHDMEAARRAFGKAFHEILQQADSWRGAAAKGGAR